MRFQKIVATNGLKDEALPTLHELVKKHGELRVIKQLQRLIKNVERRPQAFQWHLSNGRTITIHTPDLAYMEVNTALEEDRRLIDAAIARNRLQGYTPKGTT